MIKRMMLMALVATGITLTACKSEQAQAQSVNDAATQGLDLAALQAGPDEVEAPGPKTAPASVATDYVVRENGDLKDGLYAMMKTSEGDMLIELYYEHAPMTVANFVSLADGTNTLANDEFKGKKYYDGLKFHRVIPNFMIQGGDPLGTGSGGPGYKFPDEFNKFLRHDQKGMLSMANSGPATNGSQFFITQRATPHLDDRHTVYGKVVEGMETIDAILALNEDPRSGKPKRDITIKSVEIMPVGSDAKGFQANKIFTTMIKEADQDTGKAQAKYQAVYDNAASYLAKMEATADSLPSGLKVKWLNKTDNAKPAAGETVQLNYTGFFDDGRVFDTSNITTAKNFNAVNKPKEQAGFYKPMDLKIDPEMQMILGFKEAIMMMAPGDRALFFIPSHLAYGERGQGSLIKPNTDLNFEIEMLDPEAEAAESKED